jgi:hypothetical protein
MAVESIDCNIDGSLLTRDLEHQLPPTVSHRPIARDGRGGDHPVDPRGGSGSCTSAMMLGAYKKASFFDDQAEWLRTGYVVIWQSGLIFTSPAAAHIGLARESLTRLAKAMLKDWRNANAKPSAAR